MSIRKSNSRLVTAAGSDAQGAAHPLGSGILSRLSKRARSGRAKRGGRAKKDRRSLLEALEQRQLLAGPNLVGIQPNQSTLIFDGIELNSSPRELVFRFDDSAAIDPDTLSGIRITRAGSDAVFESAIATSDLGTGNQVLLEFRAVQPGTAGEGLVVNFTSSSRVGSGLPVITVNDGVINIDLNNNPARPTQVRDLISGVANHPVASQLLEVFSVSGATLFPLGTAVASGTSVTLRGANAADAVSDVGTGGDVRVRFLSIQPGPEGRATTIVLQRANAGGPANPLVLVDGNRITVRVNSNPGNETTVNELITAINTNPEASRLVTAVLEAGRGTTLVGNRANFAQTLLLTGANDIVVQPGFVGLGNSPNEVVFRFAETLPDDTYQIDIFGSGPLALANVDGEAFNDGQNLARQFRINLGPKVVAVVPEPVRRQSNGALSPEVGKIDVHFNERLDNASATNPAFYQLIYTRDTASPLDDVIVNPTSVTYNQTTNIATLTFAGPLARLPNPAGGGFLAGAARLRIGNAQTNPPAPINVSVMSEPGDSFAQALPVGDLTAVDNSGVKAIRLQSEIRNTVEYGLNFPGGPNVPGVRQIRPEDPSRLDRPVPLDFFRQAGDTTNGITTIQYEFPSTFRGDDPARAGIDNLKSYFNLISEQQKQRVREVLSLFSEYLGVQFVEVTNGPTSDAFFSLVVGDLYGADILARSGPGGLAVATRDRTGNGVPDLVVMDFQDFQQSTDDQFGGAFFRGAMLAIGQAIGFGYADSLPQPATQSSDFIFNPGTSNEPTFPSVADIVNGQFLYRPDSADIDLYRFQLSSPAKVSVQTIAERLGNASLLDTHLRLYREDPLTGAFTEIAQNDDYFSNDSLIELDLPAGRYVVGVSASGNNSYDPAIPGSGLGGRSQGEYELRITTKATVNQGIRDATGILLDGNSDGKPGGVYDFWFVPSDQSNTLYVDKAATSNGNGSVAQPFRNLPAAVAAATPGTTIRMVANGGADGRVETPGDNFSYQIGFSPTGTPLADGTSLDVPQGVRLVIDAGVIVKMRQARIGVGSTSPTVNRSDAAIQILGTPTLIGADGFIARDELGEPIPGSVIITSINDRTVGNGNVSGVVPAPQPGDWGGIDLRGEIDYANTGRRNRENEGVFLNHIQFADIRYGGGRVSVDGQQAVVSPIDMALTRATVTNSRITFSADAAMSATPDTFRETRFDEAVFQANPFTPAISRVGPSIHGNTVIDNSINGLFVRVNTRTGDGLQTLTTAARFDDTDIVHVISENLVIQGNPGGPVVAAQAPSSLLIESMGLAGGGAVPAGTYVYRIAFSSATSESTASTSTAPVELAETGQIRLTQLPTVAAGSGFTGRRLYRATVANDGTVGAFTLVGSLNATDATFTDTVAAGTTALPAQALRLSARPDGRLAIDPGTIVKIGGARIDVTFGADLIAEGTANDPVVFTSISDQRYGAGGTFDTSSVGGTAGMQAGDWGGIYVGHTSSANLDHTVVAGAGGTTRVPGGFASFNAIEVHQGDLRLANSRLEMNADGRGFIDGNQLDRVGRGENASATVFVRGAQPVIIKNDFIDGEGPVLSFDVNSLVWNEKSDPGRASGALDAMISIGNSGPLVASNRLENNALNGMEIRGGQVATEVVWDDVDMVHVVRDTIEVPNHHVFGGLRMASDARGSLVVKFGNTEAIPATQTTPAVPPRTAGIVAGGNLQTAAGQFVDIADRIGGSLQVLGHADFPVVMTALGDNTVGAGFTTRGLPSLVTDRNSQDDDNGNGNGRPRLPTGPEVDRGTLIDNDVDPTLPGFFEAEIGDGNEVITSGVTARDGAQLLISQDYVFQYSTFVTVGNTTTRLSGTTITQPATLIAPDRVQSRGTFPGDNGDVLWVATSYFDNGIAVLYSTLDLIAASGGPLGEIQVISYLDEDVEGINDDILLVSGTPGQEDFRLFTLDGPRRVGFSHGGFYLNDGDNQNNAIYQGWAADRFNLLQTNILANNQAFSIPGEINLVNLPQINDPLLGTVFGPGDVTTAHAWSVNSAGSTARVTSFLELIPSDPSQEATLAGTWNGIMVREAANDRNVRIVTETEARGAARFDSNSVPSQAQFLGELAPNEGAGDENRRLGFIVDGSILTGDDVDVYSFIGQAGTQVWLDIDRTSLGLNAVLELVDANGRVLVLSDSSLRESKGELQRLVPPGSPFNPSNARSLNVLPVPAGSRDSAYQDPFSVNPNDPGMRVILPGQPGQRNLYHVRIRSSNAVGDDRSSLLDPAQVRGGLTSGNYQLQIRLREVDETPGTQVRHADVRFATNGIQIVGGPLNGPLVGDVYETAGDNNSFATAQPLGLFEVDVNEALGAIAGPLSSNRMSKTVGGLISAETDVDWYQFDIAYQNLTRDDAEMFLATIFDINYADGYARGDLALYVFNADGELILIGSDSNIADDQPTGLAGADSNDLSRGSAGNLDPYIGVAELPEGRYFVAVANQSQIPQQMDQFAVASPLNPFLRLEPIDSVQRIVEDRVDGATGTTFGQTQIPRLFDPATSVVPYTLNDVIMYSLSGNLSIVNPFTGEDFGQVGNLNQSFQDLAFRPNGELFGYSTVGSIPSIDADVSYAYYRINSEDGSITNLGPSGLQTFHLLRNPDPTAPAGQFFLRLASNDGFNVLGMTIVDSGLGYVVGNRPMPPPTDARPGVEYFQNIVYAFNPSTGQFTSLTDAPRLAQFFNVGATVGAGTQIRERGFIETGAPTNTSNRLVVPQATEVRADGTTVPVLQDGSFFSLLSGGQQFRIEMDAGPILEFNTDPAAGIFPREAFGANNQPVRFSLTASGVTTTYELETGPVVVIDAAQVVDGANVRIVDTQGRTQVFEFNSNESLVNPAAISVDFVPGQSSAELAEALAAAISSAGFSARGFATPGQGRVDLSGDSRTTPPQVAGAGLSIFGAVGSSDPNVVLVPVRENFTANQLAQAVAEATGGAVAGNRVNYRNVTATNLTNLTALGLVNEVGQFGVTSGSTAVRFLVSDTAEAAAIRIAQVINNNPTLQAAGVRVTVNESTLVFENALVSRDSASPAFTVANVPPGGLVTGLAMVGSTLYGVSDNGGLYAVTNPRQAVQGRIGGYVATATDLLGLNFTGLTAGPTNIAGLLDEAGNPLLFGTTAQGDVYAFDIQGRLQPVFAGGETSVNIGAGVRGIEFSTLDINLWHTTTRRGADPGHGIGIPYNDVSQQPAAVQGGSSFYFGAEPLDPRIPTGPRNPFAAARQDGQGVEATYNFPGGAKGAMHSNPFSLVGYASADKPMLYFNYFLATDGVDGVFDEDQFGSFGRDQDAFRVYVIDERGVEHLLGTNNSERRAGAGFNDEFDDPTFSQDPLLSSLFDDDITMRVQPLFDNSGTWRQARVPLAEFAGQDKLRLRVEFSTGGAFGDGSLGLRAVPAVSLVDGAQFVVGGERFEIDLGPTIVVPAGSTIANFYAQGASDPNRRVTVNVGGVTYVLNDGTRNVNAGEVNVPLVRQGDGPLSTLTAETIATRLAAAIENNGVPRQQIPFDFSAEPNDELLTATRMPSFSGDVRFAGNGELETPQDVDLYRINLPAGAELRVTMAALGTSFLSNVRVFDTSGRPLAQGNFEATYRADVAQTVVIGFSSGANDNYNPGVAGSGDAGIVGNYQATVDVTTDFRVVQFGPRLQITGGIDAAPGSDALVSVTGAPGTQGHAIVLDASMSAEQVAAAMQRAIADRFSGGVRSAYSVFSNEVSLIGLTVEDTGPFALSGVRAGDLFGSTGPQRARANNFEGIYLDDFIIGFAERGEMAFNASGATDFIADPLAPIGGSARPTTGAYQLEIRDASEYINSLTGETFRSFDTNERLASGTVITALPAGQIVDGATFQLTDGVSTVTFEMDLVNAQGVSNGVAAGRARVPLVDPATLPGDSDGSAEVAAAIAEAINSPQVRSLIDVVAVSTDGIDTLGNSRLNLFGNVIILNADRVLADVTQTNRRGDKNRERSSQGVIVVENSTFSRSAQAGIEITREAQIQVPGGDVSDLSPTVITYPRNLVELNSQNLIPGVVVQSNVLAFNTQAGIRITGLDDGGSLANPVAFDRIVNNTVVGGRILSGIAAEPAEFGGVLFSGGNISFADSVVSFQGGTGVSPGFNNPQRAVGPPVLTGRGTEPVDGLSTVSLGGGGVLTLGFTDNYLTGSGDARPDLVIFEVGEIESVRVEISRDGVTFFNVGIVGGIANTVDLDAFGFGSQDRFSFVRLTDLRQGTLTSGPVGADIDAIGALSTVPRDRYIPGGQGIVVAQNVAPTLLNNVVANTETGVSIDPTSSLTVIGATTYFRNETNVLNTQANPLGQFAQVLPPSLELFFDPANLTFTPRAGVPIIDSSVDSLQDRASLLTVRNAIGLPASPILAPRLDVNGQLRVDDPSVQSPIGIGEQVFKDRGAVERADLDGPRAILVSPRAPDLGILSGQTATQGTIFDSFDIQLVDGIAPVDPAPGSGIFDPSVTSASVLLTKDGVPLVEGRDYRFGYDPSSNIIRLTPIAGIWEDDSVYVIRLLDATDAVVRFTSGMTLTDGALTTLLTSTGEFVNFEVETGITTTISLQSTFGAFDGQGLTIFDGAFTLSFELDTNGVVRGDTIAVPLAATSTPAQIAAILAAAINQSALSVTAFAAGNRLQLLGPSTLTRMTPLVADPTIFTNLDGEIGTNVGFGIRIPDENGLPAASVADGQVFTVQRGTLIRRFELDSGGGTQTPGAIPVAFGPNASLDEIADALVRAIGGAGLGLDPQNVGEGRVVLGGDANYALDVSGTGLEQMAIAGQAATIPVRIPIDSTTEEMNEIFSQSVTGANIPGVSLAVVGDRIVLNGVAAVSGVGAIGSPVIRDNVGNALQSNRDTGRTELTVFVGGGFDYGNAPSPYASTMADGGPRHRVDRAFSLGPTVLPDADAIIPGGSSNDGVFQVGTAAAGFPAQFTIDVRSDGRPFYVDAWIDWNRNGVFDPSEAVRFKSANAAGNLPILGVGVNTVSIQVPAGTTAGPTWGRFRLSEVAGLGPRGDADSGEVEDILILVQANPFQNPLNPADVNQSGTVTPLDALVILNLLAAYSRGGGTGAIPLNPPPSFLPDLVNQRFLPDVNGTGTVEAADALAVINVIRDQRNRPAGEGELLASASSDSSTFVPVAPGLLASPLTFVTEPLAAPQTVADEEDHRVDSTVKSSSTSVFDSPQLVQLDDVIDALADEDRSGGSEEHEVDAVFAGLGLGL